MDRRKGKRNNIQNSDPGKILDLVMNLNDNACSAMQTKINVYLAEECEAELVLQVVVNSDRTEATIEAVGASILHDKHKINMTPKLSEVLKSLVEHSDHLSNFDADFQNLVAPYVPNDNQKRRVLMYPISDKPFSVVVCVVAPKDSEEHVAVFIHECFLFAWPTLKKTICCEHEATLKQNCQQLLRAAKRLFAQVTSLDSLLRLAREQAKQLTKAEHCSMMLVDVDRMELVDPLWKDENDQNKAERRFSLNKGIAGHVITTGLVVNCKTVEEHSHFDPEIDALPGVDCKSLLCFPIRDQSGIIGIGQLVNKAKELYFDARDEEMALAFSVYCGECVAQSVVYGRMREARVRNALAYEMLMYHMKVDDNEVQKMLDCPGFHGHPHASSLQFDARALPLRELPCYAFKIFTNLGFDKRFNIMPGKLARFILHVKKGYRAVPYHNWAHSFNVAQWAHAAITNYNIVSEGHLTDLQALMFVIAGLVHDLDHRGTTNSFQIQGQTTLAALYSSEGSVMERHHLAQAMCILNTEGCDILENLSRKDYDRAILMLRDNILATNLANYFKNLDEYEAISIDYQKGNRLHASALQSLLMNAADLSDQLKDWGSVKKTAVAVLTEFFKQGEAEKSEGELPPTMDQDKCFIPDLQIHFLQTTCIPLFEILGTILPKAASYVKLIEDHVERWDASKPVFAEVSSTSGLSVLLSSDLDSLIDLNLKEKERLRVEAEEAERAALEAENGEANA